MRTIPSRLALIVVLAMAAPALVVHGQQNREATPQAGLVRLLDEDKVAFGVTVDARADPVALSANDDIDFVFFDMEHGPYDGCGSFASAVQRGPGGAASGMARAT